MKVGTAQSFANSGSESNFQGLEPGVPRGWNSGFRVEGVQFRFRCAEKLPNQNDWNKKDGLVTTVNRPWGSMLANVAYIGLRA